MDIEFEDYFYDIPDDAGDDEVLDFLSNLPAFSDNNRWGYVGGGDVFVGPGQLPPPKYVVDPELERGMILPVATNPQGETEWALPEFAADAAQGAYNLVGALGGKHALSEEAAMESAVLGGAPAMLPQVAAKTTPGTVRSFIGKSGKEWDQQARNTALFKEATGEDPVQIFNETGMFKAPDGEWKMYQSNSKFMTEKGKLDAYFEDDFWKEALRTDIRPLREIVGMDDPLMRNYKTQLWDTTVEINFDPDLPPGISSGSFSPSDNVIRITASDIEGAKTAVIHESQHAVQNIEDWVKGSSPKNYYDKHVTMDDMNPDIKDNVQRLATDVGYKWDSKIQPNRNLANLLNKAIDQYTKLHEKGKTIPKSLANAVRDANGELIRLNEISQEKMSPTTWYRANMGEAEARLAEKTAIEVPEGKVPMDLVEKSIKDKLHDVPYHESAYLKRQKAKDRGEEDAKIYPSDFGDL